MLKKKTGVCLISIPKSGTMFVSRYLEKLTASPVIFGMEGANESQLHTELICGWHPEIAAVLRTNSPNIETIAKRFAMMLARNRTEIFDEMSHFSRIVSDHGFHNFLRFLINPSISEIQEPQHIIDWADRQGLACVYLHRDIRPVANSLAHFLASGKSFLVDIDTIAHAADLVSTLYAPLLAEEMRQRKEVAKDSRLLTVSFESMMECPAHWIRLICEHGNLVFDNDALIETPESYRSWTFRKDKSSWRETFSAKQQEKIESICGEKP